MRKRLCCWVVFMVAIALIAAAVPPEAIAAGKMKKYADIFFNHLMGTTGIVLGRITFMQAEYDFHK